MSTKAELQRRVEELEAEIAALHAEGDKLIADIRRDLERPSVSNVVYDKACRKRNEYFNYIAWLLWAKYGIKGADVEDYMKRHPADWVD